MGQCFMLVYDITSRSSFDEVDRIRDWIYRIKDTDSAPIVLCGNKCDLPDRRQIATGEGKALAARWKCPFFETSGAEGHPLDLFFFDLPLSQGPHQRRGGLLRAGPRHSAQWARVQDRCTSRR